MKPMIIGIAGGTGGGKSTLAQRISEAFAPNCRLLCHDNYYISRDDLTYEERTKLNYDHPDSLDTPLLIRHLNMLCEGEAIDVPQYDFSRHLRSETTIHLTAAPLILVEGMLILDSESLRQRMDLKLFVDTDDDIRFIRRLTRDMRERGRSMESVVEQYLTTVKPMHDRFVYPSRRWADMIIPEGGRNEAALATIIGSIRQQLSK